MFRLTYTLFLLGTLMACNSSESNANHSESANDNSFVIKKAGDLLQIFQEGGEHALVTQNAQSDHRPYLHPILAPNSTAELTQYSPGHHKHQTGLYWGFTRVNGTGIDEEGLREWFYKKDKPADIQRQIGRDFFHHPQDGYWERLSVDVLIAEGQKLKWQTVYNMLDADGTPILQETQIWTFAEKEGKYFLE